MKKMLLVVFLVSSFQLAFSQNYDAVDSKVDTYPKQFRSIEYFANRINKDFETDLDKVRAAYYWISNNIKYDYEDRKAVIFSKDPNKYRKGGTIDLYNTDRKKYGEKALITRKAICAGYSELLKYTLLELGVEAEVIVGYAKNSSGEIGKIGADTNHAWNAVKIDNEWKLIDATWSTGNEEAEPGMFDFSDEYFLIEPRKMILNHFPKNSKWQLLKERVKKSTFSFWPLYYSSYYNSGLYFNKTTKGILKVKHNTNIRLVFDKIDTTKIYRYAFKEDKYSTPIEFVKKDSKLLAKIKFDKRKRTSLTIYGGDKGLIEFKIIPSK